MKETQTIGRFISAATVALVGLSAAAPAGAQVPVFCNMTISAPGEYVLNDDLACGTAPGLAVTADNVHINFNGHTLSGPGVGDGVITGITGVCAAVTGLHLNGGTITGFDTGIELCAAEGTAMDARVNGMTVTGNSSIGVDLLNSNDNQVNGNTVAGNGGDVLGAGIRLRNSHYNIFNGNSVHDNKATVPGATYGAGFGLFDSNGNLITSNNVTDNGSISSGLGVQLYSSDGNTVRGNVVNSNGRTGIAIVSGSNGNTIQDNTANQNPIFGIGLTVGSGGNRIQSNTAFNNGVLDLADLNAGCGTNTWKSDTFGTSNQPCIR